MNTVAKSGIHGILTSRKVYFKIIIQIKYCKLDFFIHIPLYTQIFDCLVIITDPPAPREHLVEAAERS